MYSRLFFFAALFPFVSPQYVAPPSRTSNSSMNAALKLAATNFDRHVVLSNDSDWHYDVFKHKDFNSIVGAVMNADAASFPALTGLGISIAVLKIGPCGMLQPHEHPRASNVVIGITGNITSYMIGENHVRTVTINIIPFRVTVFPIGSVHVMQNNGCEDALLISSLNSDDSGTNNVLESVASIPVDIIRASFGDPDFPAEKFVGNVPKVGTGVIRGSADCMKRCGIKP